jgi:hypothetical protein
MLPLRRILAVLATSLLVSVTAGTAVPAGSATAAPAWQTSATSWTNPYGGLPRITGLRYATHPGFDRVVIDVRGKLPSYSTYFTRTFHYDGSGAVVPIRGGLGIRFNPAYAHRSDGTSSYTGPRIARPGFPTLKAIAFTGDFEGYVNFAFGLSCDGSNRAPYRVLRLHEPQRIVIDFKHC